MKLIEIDRLDRSELDIFQHLTDVALRSRTEPEAGIYLAESAKVITRALAAGHEPVSVIVEPKWLPTISTVLANREDVPVYLGSAELLEQLTGFNVHRGAIAAFRRPDLPELPQLLADATRVVILDGIADHTNVGAAFRAVAGIGADAVLVSSTSADPLYRRSVRVSMGTVLQVPWSRLPDWATARPILRDAGFEIAALALTDSAVSLDEYARRAPDRLAIVLGSEGHGLGPDALAAADATVMIPMQHGVDSLNVASACAVAMWALRPSALHPDPTASGP